MKRVLIASAKHEFEWLQNELLDFGPIVRNIHSLDILVPTTELVEADVIVILDSVVHDDDQLLSVVTQAFHKNSDLVVMYIHARDHNAYPVLMDLRNLGVIVKNFEDLGPGSVERILREATGEEVVSEESDEDLEQDEFENVADPEPVEEDDAADPSPESPNEEQAAAIEVKDDNAVEEEDEKRQPVKVKVKKKRKPDPILDPDMLQFFDLPEQRESIIQTIVGTVFIAVMGVEDVTGCTHTSLLIANFLKCKGYHVAIIEANNKSDFREIEDMYEGLESVDSGRDRFVIKGVTYYRSSRNLDITQIKDESYDYIILDLGAYYDSPYQEEFFRAQVQIVTAHGSDWRLPKLKRFCQHFKDRDQSKWLFVLPFADSLMVKDVSKIVSAKVFAFPAHPDPWVESKETDEALFEMLEQFLGKKRNKSGNAMLYAIISVLSIVVVVLMIYILS